MFIAKASQDGLSRMSTACPNSKTHCCQRNLTTFWNTMKIGVLCSKRSINVGFGRSCAEEPDKSSLLWLVTTVKRLASAYGTKFRSSIAVAFPIVIFGMLTKRSSHRKDIMQLVKTVDRYHTWNAGIAHYVSARRALFGKHFRSRNVTVFITWLPNGSSLTTIWPENNSYHLLCDHHLVTL